MIKEKKFVLEEIKYLKEQIKLKEKDKEEIIEDILYIIREIEKLEKELEVKK